MSSPEEQRARKRVEALKHKPSRRPAVGAPLSVEVRKARAQLAAHMRWHGPDAEVTYKAAIALERARNEQADLDRHIAELVAAAPRMTPEQRDVLRRVFRYGPPE